MPELTYSPSFHHDPWFDNVDTIKASGPDGFNVRLKTIEADLLGLSTVVGQIDAALDQVATAPAPPAIGTLNIPLAFGPIAGFFGAWFHDVAGMAHPAGGTGGGTGVMAVGLPDRIRLRSMRVTGLFTGLPASLRLTLLRSSLTNATQTPEKIIELTEQTPGMANPFDLTVNVLDPALATVDVNRFRYILIASSALVADPLAIGINAVQLNVDPA